jgi:hypothetical protein
MGGTLMTSNIQYLAILILITGICHCVLNAIVAWPVVKELFHTGLFGSVKSNNPSAMALLWTEVSGIALIVMGNAIYAMDKEGMKLPWSFVSLFIFLSVFVFFLFPRGGAWALLIEAILLGIMRGIS